MILCVIDSYILLDSLRNFGNRIFFRQNFVVKPDDETDSDVSDKNSEDEDPPPVPPRTSSISASQRVTANVSDDKQNRGSYYDNCPEQHNEPHDMSFYSSSSEGSDEEEETDNHVVTGMTYRHKFIVC